MVKSIVALLLSVLTLPLVGQVSVYVFPQKQQIAVNGVQTFTAVVTGVDDKSVAWSTTCGTIIKGANSTIGLVSKSQQSCTVTATSAADKTRSATGTVTYTATPHFQEGVHPRLILTPKMVEHMRTHGWATASNPYWANGFERTAAAALAEVDSKWCFSFGGHCPPGVKPGQPEHFYKPELYAPPAVTSLVRDGSGTVTVTTASALNIWKGASVTITPAAADIANFAKAVQVVTNVIDPTHFTYKEPGHAVSNTATVTLAVYCGKLNPDMWCDTGGYKTPIYDATEEYTELFSFLSLIDPNEKNQEHYRIRAHDMMMWMIDMADGTTADNCATSGHFIPFRNCAFATNDRAHQAGMEAFPLTVDWIYSSFTPSEKKKITQVFRWWAHHSITSGPTGVLYPTPIGVMNDPSLLHDTKQLRWQMNNLGNSEYRTVAMLGLVMDAGDDPPDAGSVPGKIVPLKNDVKTSTLRDYATLSEGAWTYVHWAVAEDPGVVSSVLGVSPAGLGEGQGGLSPEGSEYGPNYGYVAMALLSLHTAGADDPTHMPQMSFMSSSHWDLWISGLLNVISPAARTDNFGSFHESTQFSDDNAGNFMLGGYIKLLMPLGLYDYYTGENPARLNAIRWIAREALETGCGNGPNGACGSSRGSLYKRLITGFSANDFNAPLYLFMLLDPTATPNSPTNPSGDIDPRPKYPTEFYAPGHHEMASRTDWRPDASWLTTHCSWSGIDHMHGNCGQTEFYRKGRWVTKSHGNYSAGAGTLSMYNNSGLTIANPSKNPKAIDWDFITAAHGAQYAEYGETAFTPTPLFSSSTPFVYEYMDQTNAFNERNQGHYATNDVAHASRTILWLKPDIIVYYDRAVSRSPGMFKRDSFNFTAEPSIKGQVARVVDTVTKQQTFLTTLLPQGGSFASSVCAYGSEVGACIGGQKSRVDDESAFLYQVADKSVPMATQFLSVMEAADAGRPQTPVSLVVATGTPMDGSEIGNSVVLFTKVPWSANVAFRPTSYSVSSAVLNHYIGGLEPSTAYGVEAIANGGGTRITVSKDCRVNCMRTDTAGLLSFTASSGTVSAGTRAYK